MRYSWSAGALLAAASSVAVQATTFEAGNYYSDQVQAIAYSNFGTAGSYKKVTTMSNGVCNFGDQPYSGGLAPFDKEVSDEPCLNSVAGISDHAIRFHGISEDLCD
jgi:hypothetical protein